MSEPRHPPDVDYLTRDYEGFRKLLVALIDRSGTAWTERSAADAGMMLVELLAHQLDLLAYAGDRVAEEAFLPTARMREHARRLAALGDHDLDRGNATSGFQHVQLAAGKTHELPAGTRLEQPPAYGDDPELRLLFETTEAVPLDARLNELALGRSVAAGKTLVHLRAAGDARRSLRALGLRPGVRLCLQDLEQGTGEMIEVRRVQGDAVELAAPLAETYLARSAKVLGNMVPIRRGGTTKQVLAARGGIALGERPARLFFAQRLAAIRRLREEAEAAREGWSRDPSLAAWWELAGAEVACAARDLRASDGALPDAEAQALDERLRRAAQLYAELLRASGFAVPPQLEPGPRVPLRDQRIALPGELADLWSEQLETLRVWVQPPGEAASPWRAQPDLLRSGPDDRHYVVETDSRGLVTLRFGDGVNGALLPADGQLTVQRVTGDLFAGDLGAEALQLTLMLDGEPAQARNPLRTSGARAPEPLGAPLVRRVQRGLDRRAIPVTADDHRTVLLEQVPGLAEVSVEVVEQRRGCDRVAARGVLRRRLEVVLRPAPGENAAQILERARALLRTARLAGSEVWVRLCEPLFVSIALVVEVHPEMSPSDVRQRLRAELLARFGGREARELGRARTRAEISAAVEAVSGVVYGQVIGFDLASRPAPELAAREEIRPGRDQVVRCLGLSDNPLCGDIAMWSARRYRLVLELGYPDPDRRPDPQVLVARLMELLSGIHSWPMRAGWPELTAQRLDAEVLPLVLPHDPSLRLSVRALMIGERTVEAIALGEGDVPILDGAVQLREQQFQPHFGLALELLPGSDLDAAGEGRLHRRLAALLSGPRALAVRERWSELTLRLLDTALARELPEVRLTATALWVSSRPAERVDRLALAPRDVPVLHEIELSRPGRAP